MVNRCSDPTRKEQSARESTAKTSSNPDWNGESEFSPVKQENSFNSIKTVESFGEVKHDDT